MVDITLPIDAATDAALDRIATATRRDKSAIAADALGAYARHEAETIAAIQRGMGDAAADRTVSHADAIGRLRRTARGE